MATETDDLLGNKISGAIFATLLVLFSLSVASSMIFAPHPPKAMGDKIAIQEATASTDTAAPDVPPDWGTVLKTADANAGATISQKCQSCHNFANGGPNQTGPNLWGVIGRKPGSHPGFSYSSAMTDFGAKIGVWDYNHVYLFIAGPQAYLSGTKMGFVGLKQPQDRVNLIAWLRQQSSSPVAIPAPNPAAAAPAPTAAAAVGATPANAGAASTPVAGDQTKNVTGNTPVESPAAATKPAGA
jgi:cytochrome c